MKIKFSTIIGLIVVGLLGSGCTYKIAGTSASTKLDGTKVDYSKMSQYKTAKKCMKVGSREDSSVSVLDAAKDAGIKNVVYVDISTLENEYCVIVYGE